MCCHGQGAMPVPRRIILFQPLSAISIQNANQPAERQSAAPPYESLILQNSEGVASSARHPLYRLHPGGGDICREAELVSSGDGPCGPSPGYARQRGRRMPADRPITQALPSGKATNLVPWLDFTRNKTARLPSLRASARLLRTSAGVDTVLPPTSRIMSPTWKP